MTVNILKVLSVGLLLMSLNSHAGLMCDPRYANNVTANLGCEVGSTNNHDVTQVNLDAFFGHGDWNELYRDGTSLPGPDGDLTDPFGVLQSLTYDGDLFTGSFSIDWGLPSDAEILFVLKDGSGPTTDPTEYVGWLLDPGDFGTEAYDFITPFINTNNDSYKQISNSAFYYRSSFTPRDCEPNCTNQVPEPAPLAMMALGLVAMRAFARRK